MVPVLREIKRSGRLTFEMDYYFDGLIGMDIGEPDDLPKSNDPVIILGKTYNSVQELDTIRRDISSRLWCTYRRNFVGIGPDMLTSDKGWGCMLRCGQMILAQALVDLHLGREWFWTPETRSKIYLNIVQRFEDTRKSKFSIHQIALMGSSEGRNVGEWFGPNTVAQVLKKLVVFDDWSSIVVNVALDSILATDEIYELCVNKEDNSWKPLMLLIPLRLGLSEINEIYISALKKCFELPGTLGMIGGRPNQALYFIGYVGEEAIFLDPHTVQETGNINNKTERSEILLDESYHIKYSSRINFRSMDPSLAVGFLCRQETDFKLLLEKIQQEITDAEGVTPIFEVTKTRPQPWMTFPVSSSSSTRRHDSSSSANVGEDFEKMENVQLENSDDEFEIID